MGTDRDLLATSSADRAWTYAILAGGSALVLTVLPLVADAVEGWSFVPFQDAVQWVARLDAWWGWVLRPALGLLIGAVGAAVVLDDEWRLDVGDDDILVLHRKDRRRLARSEIVGIHLDGKKIVIDGRGRRLLEKPLEARREQVVSVLRERGYPIESD